MKSYYYSNLFFKKKWIWFSDPRDIGDADVVTFFSYNDLPVLGFAKKEGWTSVIDLSKSLEELWQAMRQGFIGEQIKKGERKGIVVKQDDNFSGFHDLYIKFREKKGIPKDDEKVFKKYGLFFSAYLGSDLLASGVFIADEENIRAWALTSKRLEGISGPMKDLIGQANRMIIWEAIKYGKTKNLKRFDFGGIDIFKDGSTSSLTTFKEAFGGIRVKNYYYTKVYSKILKFARKIKSLIKK